MKFKRIPLWSANECAELAESVKQHPELYVDRGGFYTVGAATYQDAPREYAKLARKMNPKVLASFGGWINQAVQALDLDMPVILRDTAVPSFHVFDSQVGDVQGHPHIDEPFKRIAWPQEYAQPFSFTVAVELPNGVGGLDYWPYYSDTDIDAYVAKGTLPPPVHIPYELGVMYVHDGLTPHRIANPNGVGVGEHRITLQGHGVTLANGLTALYF